MILEIIDAAKHLGLMFISILPKSQAGFWCLLAFVFLLRKGIIGLTMKNLVNIIKWVWYFINLRISRQKRNNARVRLAKSNPNYIYRASK